MEKSCAFPDCPNLASPKAAKGLCNSHYWQLNQGRELTPLAYRRNRCVPWLQAHISHVGDECLIWPFQRLESDGRAAVKYKGRQGLAARVMCELAHGPAPTPTHEAAHSCGKGHNGCVHPQHLRWATHSENLADQIKHDTRCWGERQGSSKLKTADVLAIRAMAGAMSQSAIGKLYGVSQGAIFKIIHRKNWRHI